MHIAKLCSYIQHNAELPIIKILEEHLAKQNKHKKSKKSKNNKNPHNFKPRFQPIEHLPTAPNYTAPKTDITTTTLYNPPILKTIATQCTHPTLKTTGTQYTLPASKSHPSTYTKSQHFPLNTTAMTYQPNTHHTLKHTYRSTPSDNHHPSKRSSPLSLPSLILTPQITTHLPYHIPSRPTHKTHTGTTHKLLAPKASHTHHYHKPTLMHHAKNNNQMTKTTLTNTTQPPKHLSHNTRHKHNQNSYILQHRHNQTSTIKPQDITTSTNNIATTSHPMPLLLHKEINPAIMELLL